MAKVADQERKILKRARNRSSGDKVTKQLALYAAKHPQHAKKARKLAHFVNFGMMVSTELSGYLERAKGILGNALRTYDDLMGIKMGDLIDDITRYRDEVGLGTPYREKTNKESNDLIDVLEEAKQLMGQYQDAVVSNGPSAGETYAKKNFGPLLEKIDNIGTQSQPTTESAKPPPPRSLTPIAHSQSKRGRSKTASFFIRWQHHTKLFAWASHQPIAAIEFLQRPPSKAANKACWA